MSRSILLLSGGLAVIVTVGSLWYYLLFPRRWYFLFLRRRTRQAPAGSLLLKAVTASREEISSVIESVGPEERKEISREVESQWVARAFIVAIVLWALAAVVIVAVTTLS